MKRKTVLLISLLIVLLLTMLLFQVSFAEEPEPLPLDVYVWADGYTFEAESTDQPIHLFWLWAAMTKGQLRVFRNHSYETYYMSGPYGTVLDLSADDAEQYFGPTTVIPPDILGLDCPMPKQWWILWEHTILDLPPGEYTLVTTSVYEQPINDGFHVCSFEGDPLEPTPSLYRPGEFAATVTIIIPESE